MSKTWLVASDGTGNFTKVQSGINAALIGDTVLVAPGTYLENIRFQGRDIVLRSQAGPETTILDGSSQGRSVVEFLNLESNACAIKGFTIKGGTGGNCTGAMIGGGILVNGSSPQIEGNIIEHNRIPSTCGFAAWGGGIYLVSTVVGPPITPCVTNNIIQDNHAFCNGGGIGVVGNTVATIKNNTVRRNSTGHGDGAGIWATLSVDGTTISSNEISDNVAGDHGGGIMVTATTLQLKVHVDISGNLIARNWAKTSANDSGGGIWLDYSRSSIVRNTIVMNKGGPAGSLTGGGVVIRNSSEPFFTQNIIAFSEGGGLYCDDSSSLELVSNNILWGNVPSDGTSACQGVVLAKGNRQVDPYFCDAMGGNFTVGANSPALGTETIGAFDVPGCTTGTVVETTTWGGLKARFSK